MKRLLAVIFILSFCLSLCIGGFSVAANPSDEGFDTAWDVAEEGMVLLKNEKQALPLKDGCRIALFGVGASDHYSSGGGSSGMYPAYETTPLRALEGYIEQGRLSISLYLNETETQSGDAAEAIDEAAAESDAALVFIRRFAEEGKDIKPGKGGWLLSVEEQMMVDRVTAAGFKKVIVVLNVPGVVDTEWFADNKAIDAAVCMYYGGEAGPDALMSLLLGDANFSGKTVDTWAKSINYYESVDNYGSATLVSYGEDIYVGYRQFETFDTKHKQINYPFGFGLSYTTFALSDVKVSTVGDSIVTDVTVKNTGKVAGKEVVQVYFGAPKGKLGKPAKELAAFAKTDLLEPGESQTLTLTFPIADMSSYDDTGVTGHKAAYVLEAGDYNIYVGNSVADAGEKGACYTYKQSALRVVEQLTTCFPVNMDLERRTGSGFETLKATAVKKLTTAGTSTPAKGNFTFEQVRKDPSLLGEFVAGLSDDALCALLEGVHRNADGGDTGSIGSTLSPMGPLWVDTADGGVGLRTPNTATRWPSATLQASTWNVKLQERLGRVTGDEMGLSGVEVWLAPGMNIHRHPLCGRNFEYYSEDPFLTGKMAAAIVAGVQSTGHGCSPKHFAANNIEVDRGISNSLVSERALREIYLKGFEICVRESQPWCIMTSYNCINGVETTERYDLLTTVLRGEWGFDGVVMTDWWNNPDTAQSCLAGTDVLMPFLEKTTYQQCLADGTLCRSDLIACAERVVKLVLKADGAIETTLPVPVYNGGAPAKGTPTSPTTKTTTSTSPRTDAPETDPPTAPATEEVGTTAPATEVPETEPVIPPATEAPEETEPATETTRSALPSGLIAAIGGAVLLLAAAVVILLILRKRKTA